MKGNIRPEMITQFNEMLQDHESVLRIYKSTWNDYGYEINVMDDVFIKNNSLVYPNDDFYKLLGDFFKGYGVELSFNNTGTTFWSL